MMNGRRFQATQSAALVCLTTALAVAAMALAQEEPPPAPPARTAPPANSQSEGTQGNASEPTMLRMGEAGTIGEMHFQGADLRLVLKMLSVQGRKNIVATREVSGTVTADLYNVTFKEALDAVVYTNGFVYEEHGNLIQVMTPRQQEEMTKAKRHLVTRTFKLAYTTAADAKLLIAPALSKDAVVATTPAAAVGITPSKTEGGGNTLSAEDMLVITDYEENMKRLAELVAEIDTKPEQVLIEATILQAKLTEDNALGIDFTTLAGVSFNDLNSTSNGGSQVTIAGANTPPGVINTNSVGNMGAFRTDFNSAIDKSGGLSIGVILSEGAFFIRALETVSDVTVLANPKLLVVNKQRGQVVVGKREGYITTTVTETVATQTVEFLEIGTSLVVRPYIGRDGYIRMELHPEDSDGNVELKGTYALPVETTTEVTSNVLVRDGHTIVIGGLFRERTTAGRGQIPVLGNIPYLGALFRDTVDSSERQEIIILITPRIVKQDNDEAVSEQLKEDIDRIRIGARSGLRCWGRDRIAQTHMRWAKQALQTGDCEKALWNVDMALSINPRMIDAIELKERLTDKAYWSTESKSSPAQWIIQRMMMQELGKPYERVTPPDKPLDLMRLDPDVRKAFGIEPRPIEPLPGPQRKRVDVKFEDLTPSSAPAGPSGPSGQTPDVESANTVAAQAMAVPQPAPQSQAPPVAEPLQASSAAAQPQTGERIVIELPPPPADLHDASDADQQAAQNAVAKAAANSSPPVALESLVGKVLDLLPQAKDQPPVDEGKK